MRHISLAIISLTLTAHGKVDFASEIRPILNENCVACHGGVKEAGGVSFIYREQALGKGESGLPVIVPGQPDTSEMMRRILSDDPEDVMPKPEHGPPLKPAQTDLIRQWITEGAEWREHWSFVPPANHPLPKISQTDWPRRDLDHFILAKIEQAELQPSPAATRAEWLRRVSLDLIGLPPTPEELDAFLADQSPDAYKTQVDRLLASPRFGERWASVWMDLARYADSQGLGNDQRRNVWKYRDWLIDAFNRDLPFDQFTIEQLAGDLLPDPTLEQKLATTFHRLSQANNEGGTDDEEFRVAAVIDRVNTTWEVWQGISYGCVQCHSHPYDPIRHEEYYNFMAFFNQTADADLSEELPKLPIPHDKNRYAEANQLLNQIEKAERALYEIRREIDSQSTWHHPQNLSAEAKKAKLDIVTVDGVEEYRADPNAAAGAIYHLTFPTNLETVTALRVEFLPLDEKTAAHSAEWGGILQKLELEFLAADGSTTNIPLAEAIADEPHPFFDPNRSIRGHGRAWGTYSKFFHPRHATFVLKKPLTLGPKDKLRVTMKNGGSILASFPMISKRGRIALTDDSRWISHRHDPQVRELQSAISQAEKNLKAIPSVSTPVMREREPEFFRETRLFERGNWTTKGDIIKQANTPEIFPPLKSDGSRPDRLDLARWIASPENPLTGRVAVNRFWLELFGTGLVATPEDFGSAGQAPSHPKLLDTLAVQFTNDMNWSVKTLLREIVTSATYRQSSAVTPTLAKADPANRLLARGPRQRLTAEMVRDHTLTAAGLITHSHGGPPVHPPIPAGVWTPFSREKWKTPAPGEPDRYRRSVYTYWKRSIPYPTFDAFDAPTRELCSTKRIVSNTPIQALTTLNDPAFHEAAVQLGKRMQKIAAKEIDEKLTFGYRAATSRPIDPSRLDELRTLFTDLVQYYRDHPKDMKAIADSPEHAAFAGVASVLLNLDHALTR